MEKEWNILTNTLGNAQSYIGTEPWQGLKLREAWWRRVERGESWHGLPWAVNCAELLMAGGCGHAGMTVMVVHVGPKAHHSSFDDD